MVDLKVHFPVAFFDLVVTNADRSGFKGFTSNGEFSRIEVNVRSKEGHITLLLHNGFGNAPLLEPVHQQYEPHMDTQRLFCTGLLSTNAAEVLAMNRSAVKMVISLKTPAFPAQERLQDAETTDGELYCPKPWDLISLSPGKLMALGKTYSGPQRSLAAVRERYRPHVVKVIQDHYDAQEFLTDFFVRDGRFAVVTELSARFRYPGWSSIIK